MLLVYDVSRFIYRLIRRLLRYTHSIIVFMLASFAINSAIKEYMRFVINDVAYNLTFCDLSFSLLMSVFSFDFGFIWFTLICLIFLEELETWVGFFLWLWFWMILDSNLFTRQAILYKVIVKLGLRLWLRFILQPNFYNLKFDKTNQKQAYEFWNSYQTQSAYCG